MSVPDGKTLSRGARTREVLLDLAQSAILEKGYAATSIEELIAAARITKSGFFHHFPEKIDLGKALLRRDNAIIADGFGKIFAGADAAHDDPLEALCAGLEAYAKASIVSPTPRPGCLAAAFSYQEGLFDEEIRALIFESYDMRRRQIRARLERIAATRPPRAPIDLDTLADTAIAVVQGAIVVDRVRDNEGVVAQQMAIFIAFLRAFFRG
jgi:TetR/AcrR family transcriptional regulator, transcriptional repressor for nem operon